MEAATCDTVSPGHQQPEVEHGLQAENSTTGEFQGHKFREAQDGWFSYQLKVDGAQPIALVATYWGAEWGLRRFEILVDGQNVAAQALHADKPGDFLDVAYLLPIDVTQGKASVTVRFQSAESGSLVGRLFSLRMMQAKALTEGSEGVMPSLDRAPPTDYSA